MAPFSSGVDFGIGQPGVVIDHRVDVVEPDSGLLMRGRVAGCSAVGAPAAAVGDAAEFLHVDMHQLTRPGMFIPDGGLFGGADDLPGQRVAVC